MYSYSKHLAFIIIPYNLFMCYCRLQGAPWRAKVVQWCPESEWSSTDTQGFWRCQILAYCRCRCAHVSADIHIIRLMDTSDLAWHASIYAKFQLHSMALPCNLCTYVNISITSLCSYTSLSLAVFCLIQKPILDCVTVPEKCQQLVSLIPKSLTMKNYVALQVELRR